MDCERYVVDSLNRSVGRSELHGQTVYLQKHIGGRSGVAGHVLALIVLTVIHRGPWHDVSLKRAIGLSIAPPFLYCNRCIEYCSICSQCKNRDTQVNQSSQLAEVSLTEKSERKLVAGATAVAGPAATPDHVGVRPEGDRIKRAGVGDVACFGLMGDQLGRHHLLDRQVTRHWIPW